MRTTPAAEQSFIMSCSDMIKKHQSMKVQRKVDIFLGGPFDGYIANISAKLMPFTKNMVVAYATKD